MGNPLPALGFAAVSFGVELKQFLLLISGGVLSQSMRLSLPAPHENGEHRKNRVSRSSCPLQTEEMQVPEKYHKDRKGGMSPHPVVIQVWKSALYSELLIPLETPSLPAIGTQKGRCRFAEYPPPPRLLRREEVVLSRAASDPLDLVPR